MGDLVVRNAGAPSEHELMVFQTMAKTAVDSKMYKGIGEQAGVMMIMLSARELGIPAFQALNGGLNIIQGKVEISARIMNALIRRRGHQILVKESSSTRCVLQGKRCDTGESQIASFTIEEAQRAGLIKQGGGWTKWPTDMCYARALSRLARQLFADVIGIGYVEGEIRDNPDIRPMVEEEPVELIEMLPTDSPKQEYMNDYLGVFEEEDILLAKEYLQVIMYHFKWELEKAVQEVMKDEHKLKEKFLIWKNKRTKMEEK